VLDILPEKQVAMVADSDIVLVEVCFSFLYDLSFLLAHHGLPLITLWHCFAPQILALMSTVTLFGAVICTCLPLLYQP
jgi:hypothetical protein